MEKRLFRYREITGSTGAVSTTAGTGSTSAARAANPVATACDGSQSAGSRCAGDRRSPGGSSGGASAGNAGGDPNSSTSNQGEAPEPATFGGYANPTPAQSLANKVAMDDLAAEIDADTTGKRGSDFAGGRSYRFVTTRPALSPYQFGNTGLSFIAISPFHAHDGTRTAVIEASPEHPLRVTVTDDNKLTISPP
jgi:hypothetical protein